MDTTAATVSCGHLEGTDSDRGMVCIPPGPQATLNECDVATGSRDHDASNPSPVSSRTRRKLMLQNRDDDVEDELDGDDASGASSDEDIYYQTVAVGGRCGKLDRRVGGATHVTSCCIIYMRS